MSQYRHFAVRRGYDRLLVIYDQRGLTRSEERSTEQEMRGGAKTCIVNDAVPVFYCYVVAICYVVVKSFLKQALKFDK